MSVKLFAGLQLPGRRRLTPVALSVIIFFTLVASYLIAWDRTKGTQKRLDRAIMLSFRGHYEESLVQFDKVLSRWPRAKMAWTGKGLCLLYLGRYEEALASYEKALEIDPSYLLGLQGKGMSYDRLGRYDEAIQCFRKIQEIDPAVLDSQFHIDRINQKRNDIKQF